jgi:ABC-type multidrug transport system fused ATPase/permease subunit
LTII